MTLPNTRKKLGIHWFNKRFVACYIWESTCFSVFYIGIDEWNKKIKTRQLFASNEKVFSYHSICTKKKKQLNNHYMELKLCVINPGGAISKLHVLDVYICVTWSIICWNPCKCSRWFQLDHSLLLVFLKYWETCFSWDQGKKEYSYISSCALCKPRSQSQ